MRNLANQTSINGWIFKNKKRRNYTLMDGLCVCAQPPFGIIIGADAGCHIYAILPFGLFDIHPHTQHTHNTHTHGLDAIDSDAGIFLVSNFPDGKYLVYVSVVWMRDSFARNLAVYFCGIIGTARSRNHSSAKSNDRRYIWQRGEIKRRQRSNSQER